MPKKHPQHAVPEMLAYMLTIIRAAQEIEDPALILYGAAYRDKTVVWSYINPGLYNQVLTGRACKLKAIGSGLMKSRLGIPSCQNWQNLKSALYSTKADAPTRCASFGTCALLVLEDTPHMLALESRTEALLLSCWATP